MKRIERLVIHCTATPEGREVTAADVRRWHCSPAPAGRGWKQVGYTDIIHLDGSVERLVENNEDPYVDSWEITNGAKGYNGTSRHIVYVGGCDRNGKPKDTRTQAQKDALLSYVKDFKAKYPWADVCGHNELDPGKDCPCFDVRKEFEI